MRRRDGGPFRSRASRRVARASKVVGQGGLLVQGLSGT